MESRAEAVDDQGSGWLEVKKKHRSSSKFSVSNSAGASSRRNTNGKNGNPHGNHVAQLPKSGGVLVAHVPKISPNSSSVSKEDEKDQSYLDKRVVNEANSCAVSPPCRTMTVSTSDSILSDEEVNQKKSNVVQKTKRADLEDSGFVRHSASEIKFGEIGNDDLARCMKSDNLSDATSSNLSDSHLQIKQELVEVIDFVFQEQRCSSEADIFLEESCKGVTELTEVSLSSKEMPASSDRLVDCCDPSDCTEPSNHGVVLIEGNLVSATCSSDEGCPLEAVKVAETKEPNHVSSFRPDLGDTNISKVTSRDPSTLVASEAPEMLLPDQSSPDTHKKSNQTHPSEDCKNVDEKPQAPGTEKLVEDCRSSHNDNLQDQVSKAQIMDSLGRREEGESKERFRERLWCYLFENLNRAVDELYLLCELECDMEQVREAILVLEEATVDFRELNTRVEEFENAKRKASHLADVAPMTVKSDHRRPHALSWEVRRMTTSPHRAEILSSSLEAFKKIQEDRENMHATNGLNIKDPQCSSQQLMTVDVLSKPPIVDVDSVAKPRKHISISDTVRLNIGREKKSIESTRSSKLSLVRTNRLPSQSSSNPDSGSKLPARGTSTGSVAGKSKREQVTSLVEGGKSSTSVDLGGQKSINDKEKEKENEKEREKEKRTSVSWKSMDAWKEKRNWEEILASPCRVSSRVSHSPCMSRKSAERARILHDKLMTPDKKKKNAIDLKREAEEKHARALRIKREFENERVQKIQRTSQKLNRVTELQAVRSMKLKEGMHARHQRSETRHEAHIAQVAKRAGEESVKVNEVRFITSLNEENKKFMLHQKLHGSELRRAEKLQVLKTKQKEDMAREEAVLERRKLLEAEKLLRLVVTQRKKEEAQVRREEERKASSAAREAKTLEQLRRREERAKAQQEEAELLAQKLAERLRESEQRRKFYLEQIRERASMDFRDHSSPLMRRPLSKDGQGRLSVASGDDSQLNNHLGTGDSNPVISNANSQSLLKRRIKKIRQRLMSLKHDYPELPVAENSGIGYRTAMTTARARMGRWLQDLQRYRQARKEGASSIGLITAEMIKFMEGKEMELHASRQAGLLDFISSALPASHTSKPEACQVTVYFLRLLKVLLTLPTNRSYFLSQNLLPPTIPMLSAVLENYIKIAASLNSPGSSILPANKTSEIFDSVSEVLDGFLWTVTMIIGHRSSDKRQFQMQDGLLELVVFYQIIHRLRDLFALHDRPQVEGSPFPSSILLSINLLVALTSRSRTVSSIDWEPFSNGNPGNENFLPLDAEAANFVGSVLSNSMKDHKGPSSALDGSLSELNNASEGEQFGESCKGEGSNGSLSSAAPECSKEQQKNDSTALLDVELGITAVLDESKRNFSATCNSSSHQKDDNTVDLSMETKEENSMCLKAPQGFLLSAISETGLVSLLSLLTAVLLQANSRTSEQPAYVLPSNFEEVAIGVLKVMNNLALMNLTFLQEVLARPDLKMEFFHIMSFLLTHCTSKWKASSDQVGSLLLESLLLLSYFSLFHPGNQAVLRWGKGTTILHKVCDLPFTFFSDPELMPVLAGTLVAGCFGCEQNRGVVEQELSTEMLLSLVKSCKNSSQTIRPFAALENPPAEDSAECNQFTVEPSRKLQSDQAQKSGRFSAKTTTRSFLARSVVPGGGSRGGRLRINKESRVSNRANDESSSKERVLAAAPVLMLHSRFPASFIDRAEQFFAAEVACMDEKCASF